MRLFHQQDFFNTDLPAKRDQLRKLGLPAIFQNSPSQHVTHIIFQQHFSETLIVTFCGVSRSRRFQSRKGCSYGFMLPSQSSLRSS